MSFRILSYNIAYNNNELSNISKLADYISENQFDLVLLQEVVDLFWPSGQRLLVNFLCTSWSTRTTTGDTR